MCGRGENDIYFFTFFDCFFGPTWDESPLFSSVCSFRYLGTYFFASKIECALNR